MIAPEDCTTMAEVRAGVDALDEGIVALLATRIAFMDAAARIKPDRAHVRDEARKAAVIAHAQEAARHVGTSSEVVGAVYEAMVEACIAYEFARFDAR